MIVLPTQVTMLMAQDLLFGPTLRKFPGLRVALSEGGIGWIPFYLDRVDRHFQEPDAGFTTTSAASCLLRCSASTFWPASSPTRPGSDCAASHRCGDRWRGSVTTLIRTRRGRSRRNSYGASSRMRGRPTRRSTRSPGRTPLRFFDWDPFVHIPKEQSSVGALRAHATDVDTTRMSKEEWRVQNEEAGIGLVPSA